MTWRAGERHHRAKLKDGDVRQIRELRQRYGMPYSKIGEKFETSMWTIRDICEYRTRVSA